MAIQPGQLKDRPVYLQQYGRAWRPGNKPRLKWCKSGIWVYTAESILRIGRVCSDNEIEHYGKILRSLNRLNRHDISH